MKFSELVPWKREDSLARRYDEDPFLAFQERMNRMMEGFFKDSFAPLWREEEYGSFMPRMDIKETPDALVVSAELPGMEAEDIDVSLSDNVLTVKGEKKSAREEKDEKTNYYRVERAYGSFYRSLPLPPDVVDTEHIEADYKNGILTIHLPKHPAAQAVVKKIDVKQG